MTLSRRLFFAMTGVALVPIIVIMVAVDSGIQASLVPMELEQQGHAAGRLAADLEASVRGVRADVLVVLHSAPVRELVASAMDGDIPPVSVREQTIRVFTAQLLAKPYYRQLRVIGSRDGGRELIRVERLEPGGPVRVVPIDELQPKGDRDYFDKTLHLLEGEVYISPIELNQEHGRVQIPHVPVLRAGTPVVSPDSGPGGIVIINVDMQMALDRLRAGSPRGATFLVSERGDYLVHPDRTKEFASDLGGTSRFETEFPGLVSLLSEPAPLSREAIVHSGERIAVAVVPVALAGGPRVSVVTTLPSAHVAATASAHRATFAVALFAVFAAAVAAFFVARSITRPVAEMTAAALRFPDDGDVELPTDSGGEIGILARTLERMNSAVLTHTAALEREERKFRLVVESAPSAILVVDGHQKIVLVNKNAEKLFGYARAELIGRTIEMLVPERFRDRHAEDIHEFLAHPKPLETGAGRDLRALRKDGSELPVEIGLNPIETSEGLFVLASVIDITERKRAQDWFERIVEAAPNAKIVVNREGRITLVNRTAETLFGYSRDELIGEPVDRLVPEELRTRHASDVEEFQRDARARPMGAGRDLFACRKDGSEVPVEIGLTPIEGPEGVATLASITDITERKERDDELRRSNAELEQFAYVASHDLQEPLRMVANYTELLARRYRGKLDEKADKYIHYASDGARRMQRLVADLLSYSRVGSQGKPLAPVASGAVLDNVVESLRGAIRESGASIEYDHLPTVMADETQLRQLFQNLIGNAIKFRSEKPARIHIDAASDDTNWVFSIVDNGIGIDMRYADRIFQMFQRLHELGKFEGSGIGLAIAKRIVERHGGDIWVESEPGRGTTFRFTLQAAPTEES